MGNFFTILRKNQEPLIYQAWINKFSTLYQRVYLGDCIDHRESIFNQYSHELIQL